MNNILNENFSIITWPAVQDYMNHPDFYDYSILVNSEKLYNQVGNRAYLVPNYIINEINNNNKIIISLNTYGENLIYRPSNIILEVRDYLINGDESNLEKDENNREFITRIYR